MLIMLLNLKIFFNIKCQPAIESFMDYLLSILYHFQSSSLTNVTSAI